MLVNASLFSGMNLEEAGSSIKDCAEKAASMAVTYGANQVCNFIPSSTAALPHELEKTQSMKADPQLQLDILREMGAMVQQRVDVNTLFQMMVEGLHRGIGLDRVALCLVDPKVTSMQAKYVLGENTELWRSEMQFTVKSEQDNLFAYCLHSRKQVFLQARKSNPHAHLLDKKMRRLMNVDNCMVSTIYAGNRPIGVIVADKGEEGEPISEEQYESFAHFTQQTSMSLAMLASASKS